MRHLLTTAAAAVLCGSAGCATIPLSALGSLSSLGDSSVTVGRDIYSFGKLKSAELTGFWAAQDAAVLAARDLGLRRKQSAKVSEDGTELDMSFVDEKGAQIGVRIERRSTKLMFLSEDVGFIASFFGAEITARLFLLHLRQHLPVETKADTRPATTGPTMTQRVVPATPASRPV